MLVLIALIGANSGCSDGGPKLFPATGQVTFNDKPLANAGVVFGPTDLTSSALLATARTDTNGAFTLVTDLRPGATEGKYTVTISAIDETQLASQKPEDLMKPDAAQNFKPPKSLIPTKYNNPKDSGLSYSVSPSEKNHFDIKLTGTAPK